MRQDYNTPPFNPLGQRYSQVLNLDEIPVYTEDGDLYFEVSNLPEILTFGKHYFGITATSETISNNRLKSNSPVLFEIKDINGTVIFSDFTKNYFIPQTGMVVCYAWIKEDPLRTHEPIYNGFGTLTIVGELENVPEEWKGRPNVRYTQEVEIRKNFTNKSPLLFELHNPSMSISQSYFGDDLIDGDSSFYARNYIIISGSNLETIGGKVSHAELSYMLPYNNLQSKEDNYKFLAKVPLAWSTSFADTTNALSGTNPPSFNFKIPTPEEARRDENIFLKLRYVNEAGEYAYNLQDQEIVETSQTFNFGGTALYIISTDNLLTGSLFVGDVVGTGIEASGQQSAYIRSVHYKGFTSGSAGSGSGFMMFSGSVLTDITNDYSSAPGVGLELVNDSSSFFKFRTNPGILDIRTNAFFVGNENLQFISGSGGNIEISSSGFHLQRSGDVSISGSITATDGTIGGFTIDDHSITTAGVEVNNSTQTLFISSSDFKVTHAGEFTGSMVKITGDADVGDTARVGLDAWNATGAGPSYARDKQATLHLYQFQAASADPFVTLGKERSKAEAKQFGLMMQRTDTRDVWTGIAFDVSGDTPNNDDQIGAAVIAQGTSETDDGLDSLSLSRYPFATPSSLSHKTSLIFATNDDKYSGADALAARMYIKHDGLIGIAPYNTGSSYASTINAQMPRDLFTVVGSGSFYGDVILGNKKSLRLYADGVGPGNFGSGSISGSADSTGSFGHVMVKGLNFTTAVSESAAASGFGSGGGGGGSGDITGVDLTGGSGITISSETGTTSGDYSSTISVTSATISGSFNALSASIASDRARKTAISGSFRNATDLTGSFGILSVGAEPATNMELTVEGDISASGNLFLGTAGITSERGLTISSTKDTFIKLDADIGNSGEDDNPYLLLVQDGGVVSASIGFVGTVNKDPQNSTYTDTRINSLFIGTYYATTADANDSAIMFGTSGSDGKKVRMTIDSGQDGAYVGIGNNYPQNAAHLTVEGNISQSGNFITQGHITASGNISSSGALSTFGEVVNLVGEDPRLRLKAVGANHPGVEWHEDSTRKWVLYNDPDESDSIVFKNDSTELFKITQAGEVQVTEVISHIGDTDTKITFTDDDINITVGNVNMVDFTEGGTDEITFNEAGVDLDLRIESKDDTKAFYIDAGQNSIQLGSAATTHITASGNISASGNIEGDAIRSNGAKVARYRTDIDTIRFGRHQTPAMITGSFLRFGDDAGFHVTASGNISASGTSHTFGGDVLIDDDLSVGGGNIYNLRELKYANTEGGDSDITISNNHKVEIGDTQGAINETILTVDDPNSKITANKPFDITDTTDASDATGDTGALRVEGGASIAKKVFIGTDLNIGGSITSNITASGNISGSSTSTINVGGNITTNDSFLGQKLILGTVDATDNIYLSASDGNVIIAGDNGASGDVSLTIQNTDQSTSTGQTTTLQFMQQAQNSGKIVGGKDNVFVFGSAQNDSNMQFHTTLNGTDTERMRITSDGNVGIGTSAPTKTLTVAGDISASGHLHLGNPTHAMGNFTNNMGHPTASIKSALGQGHGDIINFQGGTTVAGQVYFLRGNGAITLADKDNTDSDEKLMMVAMGTNSTTNGMLVRGFAQVSQSGQAPLGGRVYLGDDGIVTGSVADFTSGNIVRVLGHCVDSGNTNGSCSIYFNPDNTSITIA